MEDVVLEYLKDDARYPTAADKRRRGFEFERYLYDVFERQKLKCKRPFKNAGEQVDGGIYFDGCWYLVEAKWHANPLPVSEVYSFRGKVDGKFSGTCGFFISWSGYSNECADALSLGKELKVILCDSSDVDRAEKIGWKEVFVEKLMYAALHGVIYAPDATRVSVAEQEAEAHRLEVFVEGPSDAQIVSSFLSHLNVSSSVVVVPGGGKINAIRLASTLPKPKGTHRILILDSDGNPNQENELRNLPLIDESIAIEPQIEALLLPDSDDAKRDLFSLGFRSPFNPLKIDILTAEVFSKNPQNFVERLKAVVSRLKPND